MHCFCLVREQYRMFYFGVLQQYEGARSFWLSFHAYDEAIKLYLSEYNEVMSSTFRDFGSYLCEIAVASFSDPLLYVLVSNQRCRPVVWQTFFQCMRNNIVARR